MEKYRVISVGKNIYRVSDGDEEKNVVITGKMAYNNEFPVVGDYVNLSEENQIVEIFPRKTKLSRKVSGKEIKEQIIVSNVDYIFIVTSLNNDFNINRLERYLTMVYESGATPIFLLTKSDLLDNPYGKVMEVENLAFGVDVYVISSFENEGLENVRKYLVNGNTIALIGSSGVGKSTLINALLGEEKIKTSEIREGDHKGKHTTTRREIFKVEEGYIIDTPGMRELQIWGADTESVFQDIELLSKKCKFSDCTHTKEPGCAVLKAVEEGEIEERRVINYFKLKNEASYEGLNSKEKENKKLERMFKDVGGMKNARKFIRDNSKK